MRLTTGMMAGLGLMGAVLLPAQVSAEPKIYAYPSSANYCPAGLQPITISGVICCGTPNTSTSYQHQLPADDGAPRAEKAQGAALYAASRHLFLRAGGKGLPLSCSPACRFPHDDQKTRCPLGIGLFYSSSRSVAI